MYLRSKKVLLCTCGLLTLMYFLIFQATKRRPLLSGKSSLLKPFLLPSGQYCNTTGNSTCPPSNDSSNTAIDLFHYARKAFAPVHLNSAKPKEKKRVDMLLQASAPPLPEVNFTEPAIVMLLSYQRSGSSFMGDLLSRNPNIFYAYEPLDAAYTAMYGIPQGWSVPSDITGNSDGSLRKRPEFEIEKMSNILHSLLHCEFDKLPTEVLLNPFWQQFWPHQPTITDFTKCLRKRRVSVGKCQAFYLKRVCDKRFGLDGNRDMKCKELLESDATAGSIQGKYKQCLVGQKTQADLCLPILRNRCERSPIRAVKTVRATMEEAERLMAQNPAMKLLHLFRDPRPVMLSRLKHASFRAHASGTNVAKEAVFYCSIVDKDLQRRQQLMQKYPGRVMEIIYEDFVKDPLVNAKIIYDFLGLELVPEVKQWLSKNSIKSSNIAQAWKSKIKPEEQKSVENTCKHLFQHGSKVWSI